jgi:hypothetical protein
LKELETYDIVTQADVIISLPKMKTHDQTEMTGPMKKLKGLLSDKYKRAMHRDFGLYKGIVDITAAFKPALTVVDAIICQEGLGPIFGRPVEMDLIFAGRDLAAVETVCGLVAGFEPMELPVVKEASERGFGITDPKLIDVRGEKIENVRRKFLRPMEDCPINVEGFSIIYGGVTCTGCKNTIMSALMDMKNSDQLMYLPGLTLVTGDPLIPTDIAKESIITVGKCVPKEKRGSRWAPGCPPCNPFVVDAIVGGEGKVKGRYADGERDKGQDDAKQSSK